MGVHDFEPVAARSTVQDAVHHRLREALMAGRYDPGQVLTIAALADAFATSHMPVREALRRLTAEGALETARTGSARVPDVSAAGLEDLCRARQIVEGATAALAATQARPATLTRLAELVEAHEREGAAGDAMGMLARNQEFHFTLYRSAGSDVLLRTIEGLWLRFGPYLRMLMTNMGPVLDARQAARQTAWHRQLLEALARHDGAAAQAAIEQDIALGRQLVHELCGPRLADRPARRSSAP